MKTIIYNKSKKQIKSFFIFLICIIITSCNTQSIEKGMFNRLGGKASKLSSMFLRSFKNRFRVNNLHYRAYKEKRYNYKEKYFEGCEYNLYLFPLISMGEVGLINVTVSDEDYFENIGDINRSLAELTINRTSITVDLNKEINKKINGIIIIGCSGSGKSYLYKKLKLNLSKYYSFPKRYVTRPRRKGEGGFENNFTTIKNYITVNFFQRMIENDEFMFYWIRNIEGIRESFTGYLKSESELLPIYIANNDCLKNIEQDNFLIINIYCDKETRKKRLEGRKNIDPIELNWRLAEVDKSEYAHISVFNYGKHESKVARELEDFLYLCFKLKLF